MLPRRHLFEQRRVIAHVEHSKTLAAQIGVQQVVRMIGCSSRALAHADQKPQSIFLCQFLRTRIPQVNESFGISRRTQVWLQGVEDIVIESQIGQRKFLFQDRRSCEQR